MLPMMQRVSIRNGLVGLVAAMAFCAHAQTDSLKVAAIVRQPVGHLVRKGSVMYAIGGGDSASVYRIKGNHAKKIAHAANTDTKFTSLALSPKGKLMICTQRHYLFGWYRGEMICFDFNKGLTDSVIIGFDGTDAEGRMVLNTSRRNYVFEEGRSLVKSRFKYVKLGSEKVVPLGSAEVIRQSVQEPVNKAICFLLGDIDYSFKKHKAIRSKELKEIDKQLLPGDILIKRNDYQLSNISIPGFWSHSGIYLGDFDRLDEFFSGLPMLQGKKASEYIKAYNLDAYHRLSNKRNMIIEAVGDGVCINPLAHIAKVDYFAAVRPQLSREDVFKSLLMAFDYLGFPYDYLFDFSNDDELVCSELVWIVFSPYGDKKGVHFLMRKRNGHDFLFPNDLGLQCADEADSECPNLTFVLFCGVNDNGGRAVFKSFDEFVGTATKRFIYEK